MANKQSKCCASVRGEQVFSMTRYYSASKELPQRYEDEIVNRVYIRSCRILHGSYSWLATGAANTLSLGTSAPIEHWWVILSTTSAYYTINIWVNDVVDMYRNTSWRAANQVGLACAGKNTDADEWTQKQWGGCSKKLKQFTNFMIKSVSPYYSLASNNCQDVSKQIYNFA